MPAHDPVPDCGAPLPPAWQPIAALLSRPDIDSYVLIGTTADGTLGVASATRLPADHTGEGGAAVIAILRQTIAAIQADPERYRAHFS